MPVAMPNVLDQVPGRVSCGTVQLVLQKGAGAALPVTMWKLVNAAAGNREAAAVANAPTVEQVIERVTEAAAGLLNKAKDTKDWFQKLAQGRNPGTEIGQHLRRATRKAGDDLFGPYLASVEAAAKLSPAQASDTLRAAVLAIRSLETPDGAHTGRDELVRVAKRVQQLREREHELPDEVVKKATRRLQEVLRDRQTAAVRELATYAVAAEWPAVTNELSARLERRVEQSTDEENCLAEVGRLLAARAQNDWAGGQRPFGFLPLPALDGKDAGEAILAHLNARTPGEAAAKLRDRTAAAIRERVRGDGAGVSGRESFEELVAAVGAKVAADLFIRQVEHAAGTATHSVFAAIDRHGVDRTAQDLFDLAEPTVDLAGRAQSQLGVGTQHVMVVELPRPRTPRDGEVRDRFKGWFQKCRGSVEFVDLPEGETTVRVARTLAAWPIGIESGNEALLDSYGSASREGHSALLLLADLTDGLAEQVADLPAALPAHAVTNRLAPAANAPPALAPGRNGEPH